MFVYVCVYVYVYVYICVICVYVCLCMCVGCIFVCANVYVKGIGRKNKGYFFVFVISYSCVMWEFEFE